MIPPFALNLLLTHLCFFQCWVKRAAMTSADFWQSKIIIWSDPCSPQLPVKPTIYPFPAMQSLLVPGTTNLQSGSELCIIKIVKTYYSIYYNIPLHVLTRPLLSIIYPVPALQSLLVPLDVSYMLTLESRCIPGMGWGVLILKNEAYFLKNHTRSPVLSIKMVILYTLVLIPGVNTI